MNQTILITGGASGIGRAIAESVLDEGWRAAVVDLSEDNLTQCQADLSVAGDRLFCEALDVTDEQAVSTVIARIDDSYHPLTGVVNSAGVGRDLPALETDLATFRGIIEVNLIGSFLVSREAGKRMLPRGRGSVVNIASVSGMVGNMGRVAYGASKGGVLNMTKVLAVEWAKQGVRVNAIAPGPVETPLVAEMHTQSTRDAWVARVPQGRYGTPQEIVGAALFLLDDTKSSYVTGQTLAVDGGMTIGGIMHHGLNQRD